MMKAVQLALVSRTIVLLAMAFFSAVCSPYDSSAALDLPCLLSDSGSSSPFNSAFSKSVVWDAVYYHRIARCGYEYEQMHAFQPLLPLLMRLLSKTVLRGLIPFLGYSQTLALAGYLINFLAFILAAAYLYRLGLYVLEDETMAIMSTAFFSFNPASVFYSSIYTESLFALFSFAGMWYFVNGSKWKSAISFGLSSIARSNGVLHAGFFIFQALHLCFRNRKPKFAGLVILQTLLQAGCVLAPFVVFQAYGYYQLCFDDSKPRPWCSSRIPYLYGFVQSHYWEVGFLRYFQLEQIPNFLSASPALLLASSAIWTFARHQPGLFYSLGLAAPPSQKRKAALLPSNKSISGENRPASERKSRARLIPPPVDSDAAKPGKALIQMTRGFFSAANVPFVFELLFMTGVAFFVMHVQVSTRFLSSSPVIYWFASHVQKNSKRMSYAIWSVFLAYVFVGTLLFINFYPFT